MVIQQTSKYDGTKIGDGLDRLGSLKIKLNSELIKDDIDKVDKLLSQATRISQRKYLESVIDYLNMLYKKSTKSNITLQWTFIGEEPRTFPFEIKQFKKLQIQATDYIVMNNTKMLSFEYKDLLNIMALDIVYREFGYSFSDIEHMLCSVSILNIQDTKILYDKGLLSDDIYSVALEMAVGDTPHLDTETHEVTDYFGNIHKASKYYREAVLGSRNVAMNILLQQLLYNATQHGYKIKLAGVFEDSLYFILPSDEAEEIQKGLTDSLTIRLFGRMFEINPIVKLY